MQLKFVTEGAGWYHSMASALRAVAKMKRKGLKAGILPVTKYHVTPLGAKRG